MILFDVDITKNNLPLLIMRILLISPLPPPNGGDAIWSKKILGYLTTLQLNVAHVNTSIIGKRAIVLGNRIFLINEFVRSCHIWYSTINKIIKFKPDVVHFNSNCSPRGIFRDFVTLCIVKIANIPLVMHCHCNVCDSIGKSVVSIALLKWSLRLASEVLVLNTKSEDYVNSLKENGCKILPNFIEEANVVEEKVILNDVADIVFVGHMVKTKGIFEFVEVARRFPNIRFTMAGLMTADMKDVILPNNIELIGDVKNTKVFELLDCADIFLFPTYTEGFSIALLEAMSRGLPIITTPVGSNKEMLEGSGGIIVPVGDIDGICDAIVQLKCPAIRREISQWNIVKVRNHYTSSTVVKRLMDLYRLLIRH